MFITTTDLNTHIYAENLSAITDDDELLPAAAIDAAIAEAKGYLSSYDTDAIFNATGDTRNGLLLMFCKDMAIWHLMNLCNAGSDRTVRQDRYERAISWLKSVQKGTVKPDLPLIIDDNRPTDQVLYGSNPRRESHY